MAILEILCIHCKTKEVVKNGKSTARIQRYACMAEDCGKTFQLTHCYNAYKNGIKDRICRYGSERFWSTRYSAFFISSCCYSDYNA